MSIVRLQIIGLLVLVSSAVSGIAADGPGGAAIFVAAPEAEVSELSDKEPLETYPLESEEANAKVTESSPETTDLDVREPEIAETVPQDDVAPMANEEVNGESSTPEVSPPALEDAPLPSTFGMPLELAEFEVLFMPIISVSEVGVRVRWACDKKMELETAASNIAKAPLFEMTTRNFDTWRSNAKALKKTMKGVKSGCDFGTDGEKTVNQELEKAFEAWSLLKESRG